MEKRNPPVRQKSASPPGGFYNLGGGGLLSSVQLKIAPPASVTLNNGAVTHRYYRNRTYQSTVAHRYDVTTVTVTPPLRLLPLHLRNRTYQSTVTHRYICNYRYRCQP